MSGFRRFLSSASTVLGSAGLGCSRLLPVSVPIKTSYHADSAARARNLVVMLPGIGDDMRDFERHGFISATRRAGLDCDVVTVDAHYGYYAQRVLLERLEVDVIGPAHEAGYEHIRLMGISLGGFGALIFLKEHPEMVDGAIVFAPYLGEEELLQRLDQGDVGPTQGVSRRDRSILDLWRWLEERREGGSAATIALAYGSGDKFALQCDRLARLLPQHRVAVGPGGHDWRTWSDLWAEALGRGWLSPGARAGTSRFYQSL